MSVLFLHSPVHSLVLDLVPLPQVIEHSLQSPHPSKNGRLLQRCHHNDASYQITLEYVFLNNLKEVYKEIT